MNIEGLYHRPRVPRKPAPAVQKNPDVSAKETSNEEIIRWATNGSDDGSNTNPLSSINDPRPEPEEDINLLLGPPKKSRKPLFLALAAFLFLALGGTSVWYFLFRNKSSEPTPILSDKQADSEFEPIEANKLQLQDNSLSEFDLSFLRIENDQKNLIYSPLSIKYALAMLSDASAGNTKIQIDALIGDYTPKAYLNSENRSLANALFVRDRFADSILDTYTTALDTKYHANVITDSFESAETINNWVNEKTLNKINKIVTDDSVKENDFALVNALAIDMDWQNSIQCISDYTQSVPCKGYWVSFSHENYSDNVKIIIDDDSFDKIIFNDQETQAAQIAATANRYDIVNELGESAIRQTVQNAYNEWLADVESNPSAHQCHVDTNFNLDDYISELNSNYNQVYDSTDFYMLETGAEKVFAKDLREYDGSTLQYVGIMPKTEELDTYIDSIDAEKVASLIADLKNSDSAKSYKDGVVTKLTGHIPFFKFDYQLNLKEDLESLGITDVFSPETANLSQLSSQPGIAIKDAVHKANIEFSNTGIKASAVTAFLGGLGAACLEGFDYKWDVPVETIDLTFDKPFLFLIRDKNSGEIWFTGTVYNPAE